MSESRGNADSADVASIDTPPREGQNLTLEGKNMTTIKEGLAYILIPADTPTTLDPKTAKNGLVESQSVFYNPIQQFNRDLSVLAIRAYGEDLMAVRKARAEVKADRQLRGDEKRGVKRKADDMLTRPACQRASPTIPGLDNSLQSEPGSHGDVPPIGVADDEPEKTQTIPRLTVELDNDASEPQPSQPPAATDVDLQDDCPREEPETQSKPGNAMTPGSKPPWRMKFRILDALSATGLRALRYAQEIPFTTSVTANDLSARATALIQVNVRHNRLENKIKAITGNAMTHMYNFVSTPTDGPAKHEGRYDVIDLDPYGTAVPFLDAAVQALTDGGLLCVTCTDAGVWASCGYPEKTYSLYGGTPIKGFHSHEGGLRLILHAIATSAARYGMSIEPLLSLSIDFYARVFVRVYRSPAEVKLLAGKTMLVYSCDSGCGAWQTQFLARNLLSKGKNGTSFYKHSLAQGPPCGPYCEHCGLKLHLSGPMYGGPLHNPAFLETILAYVPNLDKTTYATVDRIEGMISTALEETLLDDDVQTQDTNTKNIAKSTRPVPRADPAQADRHPFFFIPSALAKVLHCRAPSEPALRGALRHAGYRATRSHTKPGTIRTDAPWGFVWEVMREWVRQKAPIKEDAIKKGTAGWGIMEKMRQQSGADYKHGGTATMSKGGGREAEGDDSEELATRAEEADGGKAGVEVADGVAGGAAGREIVFDEKLGREAGRRRLVRYQTNPRANWGPMNRAKGAAVGIKVKETTADEL